MGKDLCFTCKKSSVDYIEIFGKYICENCQEEILTLTPENYRYSHYHNKIKFVWEKYLEGLVKNQVINQG